MLMSLHVVVEVIVLSLMTLTAFAGLSYAWWHLRTAAVANTPLWRRSVTSIGLLGVSIQALLFILFWTPVVHDDLSLAQWSRWVFPTFLPGALCSLLGTGAFRRWLVSSSTLLFVICFFFALSA
jgi:hypothetical protein